MDKFTRRDFLGGGTLAVAGALTTDVLNAKEQQRVPLPPHKKGQLPTTGRYEAVVPDTLDLAERAKIGINALIGEIEPKFDYECWWLLGLVPPSASPHSNQWFDQNTRSLWALALLRTMTGSDYGMDLEEKMQASMFARTSQDGLYFNAPFDTPGAWWRAGGAGSRKKWSTQEDFTQPTCGIANLVYAMIARYLRDGDKSMLERGQQFADAMSRIAIRKDDYAYYPATSDFGADYSYMKNSGWPDTKEALSDQDDPEWAVTCYHGIAIGALARWHAVTGDKRALETAGRFVNYVLKPRFWMGGQSPATDVGGTQTPTLQQIRARFGGVERRPAAFFLGHEAGLTYTLIGLIDYALTANDAYVKQWVRQGYEYLRNQGLARIGMWSENVSNNQMAEIAIKLSDAGAGDYWDDVDEYVRNSFVEDQYVDLDLLKQEAKKYGLPTRQSSQYGDFTTERFLGCLRADGLIDNRGTLDPTSNGRKDSARRINIRGTCYLEPFYFAWEGITRFRDGVAQVNLLLNRASAWLDIDSYLPYEGKVVLRNKTCKDIHVRIPKWVDRRTIACHAAGAKLPFSWAGNFLILSGLTGQEIITIEFPLVETVETYYLLTRDVGPKWWEHTDELPTYIFHLKGSTCVKVEFPNRAKFTQVEPMYPVFQREHYKATKAPMKTMTRYVHPRVVAW